ncbi:AMP-binding protein [Pelistega europaea]|uniref:Long-chain-fatty-acid--CoA ligase n=1 Tax=Pelistega europaea TaxID=106147 RepID=A0A7Y4LB56_9BURK|nr:AMP-binding protein [Pelistega europaea]NOL49192.1 AMP-binding protein [Pelistega europaea]
MERIWLKSYPEGIPADIDPNQHSSLVDIFNECVKKFADNTAFISFGKSITYRELDHYSRAFAAWLQNEGIKPGSRVGLMMPNILQYPICLFGALRAGCTVVNFNPMYTAHEVEHQLNDSGAEVMVVVENFASTLEEALPKTPSVKKVVVASIGGMLGFKGKIINFVLRHVKKMIPAWELPGHIRMNTVFEVGEKETFTPVELSHDNYAFLQYTGGTTGVPKGAILTHGNIVSNVLQAYAWVRAYTTDGKDLIVTALPLYHIFSLTANLLTFMRLGSSNLLIANPRDIKGFIKEISHYKFTAFTGVNTLFNALLHNEKFKHIDFSALRLTLGGGMAVQRATAERWREVTGVPLVQAYGLTETSPAATINPLDMKAFNGAIGLPISSTYIKIVDDNGNALPLNEVGEILIKGPQVMKGYWERPEETTKVFDDEGFLRTGDMGYMDDKGFVYLVDRKKDLIIVSGFNVYPNEVEEAVASHPGVLEVAAVGVDNGPAGELVKVFVVRKDPNLTEQEIIQHCRHDLTNYKVPKQVAFVNELPKNNVGKILRRELRGK